VLRERLVLEKGSNHVRLPLRPEVRPGLGRHTLAILYVSLAFFKSGSTAYATPVSKMAMKSYLKNLGALFCPTWSSEMDKHSIRAFNLVDVMILLAATAAAMGWVRANYDWYFFSLAWRSYYNLGDYIMAAIYFVRVLWPFLLTLTLTTLALRMRRPRPQREALARQPGVVACCAATVATAAIFWPTLIGIIAGVPGITGSRRFWDDLVTGVKASEAVGVAVAAAWMTLALVSSWRPEPSWIDRLGRGLGTAWIVLLVASGALDLALCLSR